LNPFEPGFADSEEIDSHEMPRAVPRVIASLVVAFFAYIGFALGGGFGGIAGTDASSFAAGKSNQPLYLSLRDNTRGIMSGERDVAAKGTWHDGAAALVPAPPSLPLLATLASVLDVANGSPAAPASPRAYLARAPPAVFLG
jgi:hypothetical protein